MRKTLFSKKEWASPSRWFDYFSKKGFYIALFFCIFIVGITGFYVTKTNMEYYMQEKTPSNLYAVDEIPFDAALNPNVFEEEHISAISRLNELTAEEKLIKDEDALLQANERKVSVVILPPPVTQMQSIPPPNIAKPKEIQSLIYPVQGEILVEFAKDKLVYSKTLQQWGTHHGIAIKGERGTPVKAAADGVIEKIYHDEKLGITIIIDHNNGLKTKYSNLSMDNMVEEKQQITQGTVISGVGNTAFFKVEDPPHLHFEVIKNGEPIDPRTLLPN